MNTVTALVATKDQSGDKQLIAWIDFNKSYKVGDFLEVNNEQREILKIGDTLDFCFYVVVK